MSGTAIMGVLLNRKGLSTQSLGFGCSSLVWRRSVWHSKISGFCSQSADSFEDSDKSASFEHIPTHSLQKFYPECWEVVGSLSRFGHNSRRFDFVREVISD